jgi:hypothetical protein
MRRLVGVGGIAVVVLVCGRDYGATADYLVSR